VFGIGLFRPWPRDLDNTHMSRIRAVPADRGSCLAALGHIEIERRLRGDRKESNAYVVSAPVLEVHRRWRAAPMRSGRPRATAQPCAHGVCGEERSLKTANSCDSESEKSAGSDLQKGQVDLERCAPLPEPQRPAPDLTDLKRRNLIKGIRSTLPFPFPDDWQAQLEAGEFLQRSEAAIPNWKPRSPADKAMFERLVELTRRHRGTREPTWPQHLCHQMQSSGRVSFGMS
jgi:hypothetical protein